MAIKIPIKLFHVTITGNGATDRTQLPSYECSEVTLTAKSDNSGTIYWGDANVTNASGILQGHAADAGEGFSSLKVANNSNEIWIAADSANDKVIVTIG